MPEPTCPLFDDNEHDNYRCRWCWGLPAEDHTDDDLIVHLVENDRSDP